MTNVDTASWRAIGTGVRLVVHDGDLAAARTAVEALIDTVDRAYSRFRDDSEIVRLNEHTGERMIVSPLLAEAIAASLRAARLTGGAVDPTVGRAMRAIGYDADFDVVGRVRGPIDIHLEPVPGWEAVELTMAAREVRVRRGVELDLGSTGKALAADLAAAAALTAAGGGGVLVSLGGDIAVRGHPPIGGWRILVAEDSEATDDADGEVVAIETGALATSSTTVRRWRRGDRMLHHLVDPRTGGPVVSRWRTASVVAATCVDANTAATASIVMGEAAISWLSAAGLAARLVAEDGSITRVGGWPEAAPGYSPPGHGRPGPGVTGSKGEAGEHAPDAIRDRPPQTEGAPNP